MEYKPTNFLDCFEIYRCRGCVLRHSAEPCYHNKKRAYNNEVITESFIYY